MEPKQPRQAFFQAKWALHREPWTLPAEVNVEAVAKGMTIDAACRAKRRSHTSIEKQYRPDAAHANKNLSKLCCTGDIGKSSVAMMSRNVSSVEANSFIRTCSASNEGPHQPSQHSILGATSHPKQCWNEPPNLVPQYRKFYRFCV